MLFSINFVQFHYQVFERIKKKRTNVQMQRNIPVILVMTNVTMSCPSDMVVRPKLYKVRFEGKGM